MLFFETKIVLEEDSDEAMQVSSKGWAVSRTWESPLTDLTQQASQKNQINDENKNALLCSFPSWP